MAVNDTHFFTAQGLYGGQSVIHTLHFREAVAATGTNADQQLIDRWQATCQGPFLAIHPPIFTLNRLTAQRICGTLPLPSRTEETVSLAGTRTVTGQGDALAPWLAVAVNENSGLAGRTRHGRWFHWGGYEGDVQGDTLISGVNTWLAAIQAYVDAVRGAFVTGTPPLDWVLVVHSRKLAEGAGVQCQDSSTPVTSLAINARLTTQRSRRA